MSLVDLALVLLSIWRSSHFLADTDEDGPWDLAHKIRHFLGVRYDELGVPQPTNMLSAAALCVWCNSVWIGAIAAIVAVPTLGLTIGEAIWIPLAGSAFSIYMEERITS